MTLRVFLFFSPFPPMRNRMKIASAMTLVTSAFLAGTALAQPYTSPGTQMDTDNDGSFEDPGTELNTTTNMDTTDDGMIDADGTSSVPGLPETGGGWGAH